MCALHGLAVISIMLLQLSVCIKGTVVCQLYVICQVCFLVWTEIFQLVQVNLEWSYSVYLIFSCRPFPRPAGRLWVSVCECVQWQRISTKRKQERASCDPEGSGLRTDELFESTNTELKQHGCRQSWGVCVHCCLLDYIFCLFHSNKD